MDDFVRDVSDLGVLSDDLRRELYMYVCSQPAPVGRDQAAEALGIARHQVKFHLDRLEAAGLLDVDYVRLTGRTGPGAGRPAKVYRRADREVSVSLPGREYALAGELMAEAITRTMRADVPIDESLGHVARARGRQIDLPEEGTGEPLEIAARALARFGYEPRVEDGQLMLTNCPFHDLAESHTDLVCGMNHALLTGACERLAGVHADLDPAEDRCCVVLRSGS